ncbi:hypothetical protein [Streptomyces chartreusis]
MTSSLWPLPPRHILKQLGAAVVRHYATAAHVEINEHLRQVTDVERERGFDPG